MPTAKFARFDIQIETDVSTSPTVGAPSMKVSVNGGQQFHHRVLPYFVRQRTATKYLLSLACSHPVGAQVGYVHVPSPDPAKVQPAGPDWQQEFVLPAGAKKTSGYYTARGLKVVPITYEVTSRIDCRFTVSKRWDSKTQDWVEHPSDADQEESCAVEFKVAP